MKKRTKILFAIFTVVVSTVCAAFLFDNYFEKSKNLDIFTSVYKELSSSYVDDIDSGELMKTAIDAMLESLDPYTTYIPESEIEDFRFQTTGEYGGIGAMISKVDEYVVITEPYEGFPAQKAGLIAGDKILKINGQSAKGKNTEEVSKILKGQPNTPVTILVERAITKEELSFKFNREQVTVASVPYSEYIEDGIGYIKLNSFTRNCSNDVKESILKLKKEQKLNGLILDLRGNGGGLLNESVEIVNLFVDKGEEVVRTKGKIKSWDKSYKATKKALDKDVPLVILINSSSASASEIVSGAVQDLDRGVIIGQRSFGKGLVQQTKPLPYNAQLKLTVAKYYIPSGRCIQALDYSQRNSDGSVGKIPDSLMTEYKTRNGRIVKDGGGILPDILIEKDNFNQIVASLYRERLFFDYASLYHNNVNKLSRNFVFSNNDFSDFKLFLRDKEYKYSTNTEEALQKLKEDAQKEEYFDGISDAYSSLVDLLEKNKSDDLQKSQAQVKEILTGEIMSRYYYQKGRIIASLNFDDEVKKAIEILKDKDSYNKLLLK